MGVFTFIVWQVNVHTCLGCTTDFFSTLLEWFDVTACACGLVYFLTGISRSPTLVMAYLMIYGKKTLAEALDCVTQSRKIASPNSTFFQTLIDLEQEVCDIEGFLASETCI